MTIKLDGLTSVLLFALVGAVLWSLRHRPVTVVTVPQWALEDIETEDVPATWGDIAGDDDESHW